MITLTHNHNQKHNLYRELGILSLARWWNGNSNSTPTNILTIQTPCTAYPRCCTSPGVRRCAGVSACGKWWPRASGLQMKNYYICIAFLPPYICHTQIPHSPSICILNGGWLAGCLLARESHNNKFKLTGKTLVLECSGGEPGKYLIPITCDIRVFNFISHSTKRYPSGTEGIHIPCVKHRFSINLPKSIP